MIDISHTFYCAAGYLFSLAQPRMAAICHFEWTDDPLMAESVAQVRAHWEGLFMFGLDRNVINITNDAIWARQAVVNDGAAIASMDPRWMVPSGSGLPDEIETPVPRNSRENQQEQFLRDLELKPVDYYPPDVYRDMVQTWPGVKMNPCEMLAARGIEVDPEWVKS